MKPRKRAQAGEPMLRAKKPWADGTRGNVLRVPLLLSMSRTVLGSSFTATASREPAWTREGSLQASCTVC